MRVNLSTNAARELGDELFNDDEQNYKPHPTRRHNIPRVRQKWPLCPVSGKRRLTEHAAQMHLEAVQLLGRNKNSAHLQKLKIKRYYLCPDCGDYHLTSKRK